MTRERDFILRSLADALALEVEREILGEDAAPRLAPAPRKPVGVGTGAYSGIRVVCDDGSVWEWVAGMCESWAELDPIPGTARAIALEVSKEEGE